MTYYLAAERLRPQREVVVAPYDASPVESVAGLVPGDSLSAEDLLYGLMLPSGNDAANTLAIAVSGSVPDFVARMNRIADRLELGDTAYEDPIGLSSGNVSSARDLVDLTVALREKPLFRQIVDTPRITLRSSADPIDLVNRNNLVLEEPFVNGVKTGTTLDAGYVLVSSGRRDGVELISAFLGAPDEASRDSGSLRLLEYGFSLYEERAVVKRGEPVGSIPISGGRGDLEVNAATGLRVTSRADQKAAIELAESQPVEGPVAEGDPVASAVVTLDGEKVGRIDVVAAQAVAAPPEPEGVGGLPVWAVGVLAGAGVIAALMILAAVRLRRS